MLLPRISCSLHMFTLQQGCPIFFSRESHDNKCVCVRAAKTDSNGGHSLLAIQTLAVTQEQPHQLD
jgi:hypothetical protein